MSSSTRSVIISVVLTTALFGALAYLGWRDHQNTQTAAPTRPTAMDASTIEASRASGRPSLRHGAGPAAPASTGAVHKCRVGDRLVYQDEACAGNAAEPLDGGTLSVVDAPRILTIPPNRMAAGHGARVTVLANPDARPAEPAACPQLRGQVRQIDAAARQRSTQALTEQRRHARDRMYALGCSEID